MTQHLHLYYDEEGDFLELQVGKPRRGYFRELREGVFERVDEHTKEVIGVAIVGFRERTKDEKGVDFPLPIKLAHTIKKITLEK